ncbi:MAG: insulinase family protein [Gemmatimonadetes bacterium]|jgi:predicted Zn-dependent peptidase|nr:insulinase family protein [Gemmatimonadota bacterium]
MLSIPVERLTLDNGLRVNLSHDPTTPVVAINIWYGVGSRNEREGKTGFAHLFEHMMFQGSEHVPKNRHFELIERAGGSLNATTWFDRTNYFETVPSHHLELALWLESDRMGWMLPAMTQEKLDNQRDVVMNEKRERYDNQPYGDWDEWIQAMVFPESHPYHHTVIGSMADIEAATLEDVAEFFRTFYVPNNAVLTVCGDFSRDEALGFIERHFGEIPRGGEIPAIPGEQSLDPVIGTTVRERVEAEVPLPRVLIAFRVPTYTSDDFYAADVAGSVLGTGRASRLYRSLVREQRVAKDVTSFVFPLTSGAGMLLAWATGFPEGDPVELETALIAEIEGLASVTEQEIERAVALTETALVRQIERVGERADLFSMFDQLFDDPERLNSELDRLRAVTPGDVSAFVDRFLGTDNRAILTYVPEAAKKTPTPSLR